MNFDFDRALQGVRQGAPSFQQAISPSNGFNPFASDQSKMSDLEAARAEQAKATQAQEVSSEPSEASSLKVLFISDLQSELESFARRGYEAKTPTEAKLEKYFKIEVIELFARMVAAMGLGPEDFKVLAIKAQAEEGPSRDLTSTTEEFVLEHKPSLIITLGATATNSLLNLEERLATVHGKFLTRVFSSEEANFSAKVMPLFHPQLLQINPGMKRTAWVDMQKAMEFLKLK